MMVVSNPVLERDTTLDEFRSSEAYAKQVLPFLTDVQRRGIASLESRLEHIAHVPSVIARVASVGPDGPCAIDQIVALNRVALHQRSTFPGS